MGSFIARRILQYEKVASDAMEKRWAVKLGAERNPTDELGSSP
jgi:hypothetical protein